MSLRELIWTLDSWLYVSITAGENSQEDENFLGAAEHARLGGVSPRYLDCMVEKVTVEYLACFEAWGIVIVYDKNITLEG